MTLLRGIFVSFSSWYNYWGSREGSLPLAKGGPGKRWKKSTLVLQHQSSEWDESFRPELNNVYIERNLWIFGEESSSFGAVLKSGRDLTKGAY